LARECVFLFDVRTRRGGSLRPDQGLPGPGRRARRRHEGPLSGPGSGWRPARPPRAWRPRPAARRRPSPAAWPEGQRPRPGSPLRREAGQFQGAGYSTVICGRLYRPGHQPDEYVEIPRCSGGRVHGRLAEALAEGEGVRGYGQRRSERHLFGGRLLRNRAVAWARPMCSRPLVLLGGRRTRAPLVDPGPARGGGVALYLTWRNMKRRHYTEHP